MAIIGNSILTNLGMSALQNALVSNPINIASFVVSNQTITLDPTLTSLSGWITKPVTGLILLNDNTIEITCIVEPAECTNIAATIGIMLSDGTLFMLTQPSSPLPPSMRQVIKTQLVFSNLGNIVNFSYLPWDYDSTNVTVVNNQTVLSNSIFELSAAKTETDTWLSDYYNFKSSHVNYRNVWVNPVTGVDYPFRGVTTTLPLNTIDYAMDINRFYKNVNYQLNSGLIYNISYSHNIFDNHISFIPTQLDTNLSTNNPDWKVLDRNYSDYNSVMDVVNNTSTYAFRFTNSLPANDTCLGGLENINLGITYKIGSVNPGYWVAVLPINNPTALTYNVNVGVDDSLALFASGNTTPLYQTPNFYMGQVSSDTTGVGECTGILYNASFTLPANTQYIIAVIFNYPPASGESLTPSMFAIQDTGTVLGSPTTTLNPNLSYTQPYQISPLIMNGNASILFQNLIINIPVVSLGICAPFILANKNTQSVVTFENCTINMPINNTAVLGTSGYNNGIYFDMYGDITYKFYNCKINTNGSTLILSQNYDSARIILDNLTVVDNMNNLVGSSC